MSTIDNGPATGTGVIKTTIDNGIEVHVGGIAATQPGTNPNWAVNYQVNGAQNGTGTDPEPPMLAPYVDPGQAGTNITGNPVVPINKTIVYGVTGATQVIANPA
jgi:hypothetical protein